MANCQTPTRRPGTHWAHGRSEYSGSCLIAKQLPPPTSLGRLMLQNCHPASRGSSRGGRHRALTHLRARKATRNVP